MDQQTYPAAEDQTILDLRRLAAHPSPEAARELLEQWGQFYDNRDAWRAR